VKWTKQPLTFMEIIDMNNKIVSFESFAAAKAEITKNQLKSIEDEIKSIVDEMDFMVDAMIEQNEAEEYDNYRIDAQALAYHCDDLIDKIDMLKRHIPD